MQHTQEAGGYVSRADLLVLFQFGNTKSIGAEICFASQQRQEPAGVHSVMVHQGPGLAKDFKLYMVPLLPHPNKFTTLSIYFQTWIQSSILKLHPALLGHISDASLLFFRHLFQVKKIPRGYQRP